LARQKNPVVRGRVFYQGRRKKPFAIAKGNGHQATGTPDPKWVGRHFKEQP